MQFTNTTTSNNHQVEKHTVEKIGGTSMSDYVAVRDNIVFKPVDSQNLYQRIFVVSAYGGITNLLLEHKKTSQPGIFALFAAAATEKSWLKAFEELEQRMLEINQQLFSFNSTKLAEANDFIRARIQNARQCLLDLQRLCQHGHFSLTDHLDTVREMLASIGEAHSAWNTAKLLQNDGVNAVFVDLTGWKCNNHLSLDERIRQAFANIDLENSLPIVTGYAHSESGLMTTFDRGYSEMTFSRIAVLTRAREVVIHKEFHLSSADPRLVGEKNAVPIGLTNYDVADQLANLGMEAIHPRAAKGLRQMNIPLRVKNTFEPEHAGTLITSSYISEKPQVEIIAGTKGVYAISLFDQDMAGNFELYDHEFLSVVRRFKARVISKDVNANSITHYLDTNLKTLKRIIQALEKSFPEADIDHKKLALVSAIGSDLNLEGILSKSAAALSENHINVLAVHQTLRQVEVQFVVNESDYENAVKSLHQCLIEVHEHGEAISLAS